MRDKIRIHVLYEHDENKAPYGAAYIRLINPLCHASVAALFEVTFGQDIPKDHIDAVIFQRLVVPERLSVALIMEALQRKIPIIYEIDDNLLALGEGYQASNIPSFAQKNMIRRIARAAAGVIVSTEPLAKRCKKFNSVVKVIPNQLDEKLFSRVKANKPKTNEKLVIGYMGTFTHLDDLLMMIAPLRRFLSKNSDAISLELIGISDKKAIDSLFCGLPVTVKEVPHLSANYPGFCQWMQREIHWDFAIAPLVDSYFNQCKSDLKQLDYGVLGIPAIFSDVEPYKNIQREHTGLVVENTPKQWQAALSQMANDTEYRYSVSQSVQDYVWDQRMLSQNVEKWVLAIRDIIGI